MRYEIKQNMIERNWDIVAGRKEILKGMADQKFAEKVAEELNKAYEQGSADRENIDKKIDDVIKNIFF
ncbi:hypothetical protein [Paenibacillus sp. FJAT-27812]|uniref:hypothetical protein n=1 Tax=Paenibacillus sp. FJAT-27812 TaxID=1684143 RepID=UPI0006A7EB53|nr:hypothetical protein [Paenibacillus sp. FJAT-27812]